MVRAALKGSLATLAEALRAPLRLPAADRNRARRGAGIPHFAGSRCTRRIFQADARASLLIDGTGTDADPMAGGRITLIGEARPTTSATARRRFLARHPAAEGYADFPDFSFYAFDIASAHFIGGFGRIVDLKRDELLIDVAGAEALIEREADIVEHMNEDHADAIELYATRLLSAAPGRVAHERHRSGRLRSGARLARAAAAVRNAHHQRRGSAQGTRPPRRRSPRQSCLGISVTQRVGTSWALATSAPGPKRTSILHATHC